MKKRVLSLVLSFAMLLSLLPAAAMAEELPVSDDGIAAVDTLPDEGLAAEDQEEQEAQEDPDQPAQSEEEAEEPAEEPAAEEEPAASAEESQAQPAEEEGGVSLLEDETAPKGVLVFTKDFDDSVRHVWYSNDDNRILEVEVNKWYNTEGVLEDLPSYAKVSFKWYQNGGGVSGTGMSATDRTATWKNPYIWYGDVGKEVKVTVKATCTIDGVEYTGTSSAFNYVIGMNPINVTLTVSNQGQLGKTKDNAPAVDLAVKNVEDTNLDFKVTVDEVLAAAHEQYLTAGDFACTAETGITKMWGTSTANNVQFYVNGAATTGAANTITVADKGAVYASVNSDDTYKSDVYTKFDATSLEREPNEEFTLTLTDIDGKAVSGVQVGEWKDGTFTAFTGKTTDAEGKVVLSLAKGDYLISAKGTSKGAVPDGSVTEYDRPIMAPYCTVKVDIPHGDVSSPYDGGASSVQWVMDSATGTLTFSGTGDTKYSDWSGDPWAARYQTKIKKIVFGEGIKEVYLTFKNYTALEEVQFPASMTKMNQSSAFENCTALKTLTFAEGCQVQFGGSTFSGCTGLETVNIPAGVKLGYSNFFKGCTGLKEATVNENPDSTMFSGCTALEKVTFAEGVTTFGQSTFTGCTALKTVYVPASLTDFGVTPFDDITKITFEGPGKDNFDLAGGFIYNKDKTGLFGTPETLEGTFELPASVVTIGTKAFAGRTKLTEVTFATGSKLETVGDNAFDGCTGLTKISLPEGTTTIKTAAFQGCTALESVKVPSTLKTIGTYAFMDDTSLAAISLPEGLETIDTLAFRNCTALTELKLPESLTTMGRMIVAGSGVEELIVPEKVTEIGAFGNGAYTCPNLKRVVIKGAITSIPSSCFSYCTNLESLYIPATVTSFPNGAMNTKTVCVIYFGGSFDQVQKWAIWSQMLKSSTTTSVVCNYGEPTTETGALEVKEYPEDLMGKAEELAEKSITLTLSYPEGTTRQEGDQIVLDWYYTPKTPDGMKYVKHLTDYTFDESTLTTTVNLTEQAAKNTTGNWYYICRVYKTDAQGNVTLLTTKPVSALLMGPGMDFAGKGKESDPFLITSYDEYQNLAKTVNNGTGFADICFKLTTDLTLTKASLQLGRGNPFQGNFDGDNHVVTIENGGTSMFGTIQLGTVKNVKVQGEYIEGSALASSVDEGTVQGCQVVGNTKTSSAALAGTGINGAKFINCEVGPDVACGWDNENQTGAAKNNNGSIIASATGATILNCKSAATVYGKNNVGGLVGKQNTWNGIVTCKNSQFTGKVIASGEYAGGIMGRGYDNKTAPNAKCSSIENCYVNADITGARAVGGIFGGEGGVDQCWDNGIGRIRNNVFIGALNLNGNTVDAEGAVPADNIDGSKGGIVGFMRSLNKNNLVENNYYYVTNDSEAKGFGAVEHIDTSAVRPMGMHDDGTFYYDTSVDSLDEIKAWVDREDIGTEDEGYTSVCNRDFNRADDPLGADADKVAKGMTETELKDGSIVEKLNSNANSMKNWVQGENGPELSDKPVVTELTLSGTYKTEYYIGEALDMTGAVFTADWSDGSTTTVDAADITFTGFDSSERKVLTVRASYGSAACEFTVKVLKSTSGGSSGSSTIPVYFTLLGDTLHGEDTIHTLKDNNLVTWISQTRYDVDVNATVADLLKEVEKSNDQVSFDNPTGQWVYAVTFGDVTLEQLDNTTGSGWMYTLNGTHPLLRVDEQFLESGDRIVFHWTDDYTVEEGSEPWNNGGSGGGAAAGVSDSAAAAAVDKIIDAIGTVTADSKAKIESARAAYDKLTDAQKQLVKNYDTLVKAETELAKLTVGVPFVDVEKHWALDAIKYAYENKLMNGVDASKFAPDATLTRAMLVTVLYRMAGSPAVSGESRFTDVASGEWYAAAVKWAADNGIVEGVSEHTFAPTANITREQFAAMLYRYAQYMKYSVADTAELDKFADAESVSDWAQAAMKWAVGAGLITGRTATTVAPGGTATRGEAATLLMRFGQNVAK